MLRDSKSVTPKNGENKLTADRSIEIVGDEVDIAQITALNQDEHSIRTTHKKGFLSLEPT